MKKMMCVGLVLFGFTTSIVMAEETTTKKVQDEETERSFAIKQRRPARTERTPAASARANRVSSSRLPKKEVAEKVDALRVRSGADRLSKQRSLIALTKDPLIKTELTRERGKRAMNKI